MKLTVHTVTVQDSTRITTTNVRTILAMKLKVVPQRKAVNLIIRAP